MPQLIERLWKARDIAKKQKNERASWAIKTVMNSFWGVLANSACRFFSMELAGAITAFARHTIQLTISRVQEMGYEVIYGDTDSIFINSKAKSLSEADAISERIEKDINVFYTKHVKDEFHRASAIELESDKIFTRFIMPRVRGSEEGAKKRYAGIIAENGVDRLDITGLEFVRRDWTELAKRFQETILKLVFAKEDPAVFIREYVKELLAGNLDEMLLYRKAIRKELEEYTKTTPPHVKAARLEGTTGRGLVEYVMTLAGPEPISAREHGLDHEHYVEKQLRPVAEPLLELLHLEWDDLVGRPRQLGLF